MMFPIASIVQTYILTKALSSKLFPSNYGEPNLFIRYMQMGIGSVKMKFPYFKYGTYLNSHSFAFVRFYRSHSAKVNS